MPQNNQSASKNTITLSIDTLMLLKDLNLSAKEYQKVFETIIKGLKHSIYVNWNFQILHPWQVYALLGRAQEAFQQLGENVSIKDDGWRMQLIHYLAWSGEPEALEYIKQQHFNLLEKNDSYGRTIAHYAAWSGNIHALDWIKQNTPELPKQKDSTGRNLAHFAAWSGNPEALDWIKHHYPELLGQKDKLKRNIAHYAAWSGNVEALAWIQINMPELLSKKDSYNNAINEYARASKNSKLIEKINNNVEYLIIDEISELTAQLIQVAEKESEENFKEKLAELERETVAIQIQVLARQVTLEKTILQVICKNGDKEKLLSFAQQGGMLLANQSDEKNKHPRDYCPENFLDFYNNILHEYADLTEAAKFVANLHEKSHLSLRDIELCLQYRESLKKFLHLPLAEKINQQFEECIAAFDKKNEDEGTFFNILNNLGFDTGIKDQNNILDNNSLKSPAQGLLYPSLTSYLASYIIKSSDSITKIPNHQANILALTLLNQVANSKENQQSIKTAIMKFKENESINLDDVSFITTQHLLTAIKRQVTELDAFSSDEVAICKSIFLNFLIQYLYENPFLAMKVDSVANKVVNDFPENNKLLLLEEFINNPNQVSVIDVNDVQDMWQLTQANTTQEVENIFKEAFNKDFPSFSLPRMNNKEKENWLEKFESLSCPKELIQQAGISEQKYFMLYQMLEKAKVLKLDIEYAWQLQALLGDMPKAQKLLESRVTNDNKGMQLSHYAALSGQLDALEWIKSNTPEKLDSKDNADDNLAHYAACSRNTKILEWIKTNRPELLLQKNILSRNIGYMAALAGNQSILEWVHSNYPMLLGEADKDGNTIAHAAAHLVNVENLKWIKKHYPHLLNKQNIVGNTIAHTAACAGNIENLKWIKKHDDKLLEVENETGSTIAHMAAWHDRLETLKWIEENVPNIGLDKENKMGRTIAHMAAWSGGSKILEWIKHHPKYSNLLRMTDLDGCFISHYTNDKLDALNWLKTNLPKLLKQKPHGYNIAHTSAAHGLLKPLIWISQFYPKFLEEVTNNKENILHLAIKSNNPESLLIWIQENMPHLWVKDNGVKSAVNEMSKDNSDLKKTLLEWLNSKNSFLILDKIGALATKLIKAARNSPDDEFIATLAKLAKYDPITRVKILTRRVTTDRTTALHEICKSNNVTKIDLLAQQGGMLLATSKDAFKKNPVNYCTKEQKTFYENSLKQYSNLGNLLNDYLTLQDRSKLTMQVLIDVQKQLLNYPDDCELKQEIKKQNWDDMSNSTFPQAKITLYLASKDDQAKREIYIKDEDALDYIFTLGTTAQKREYCSFQNKEELFKKMFVLNTNDQEYQLNPKCKDYNNAEILKEQCIFPYLRYHLENSNNKEIYQKLFTDLCGNGINALSNSIKSGFFSNNITSNNPFIFISSMKGSAEIFSTLREEYICSSIQENNIFDFSENAILDVEHESYTL